MWEIRHDKNYSLEELFKKIEKEKWIELKGFLALISDLFTDYDVFESGSTLREDYKIFKEELSNCVKKTLLEIKN